MVRSNLITVPVQFGAVLAGSAVAHAGHRFARMSIPARRGGEI
jgi:hypothetical protein